MIPEIKKLLKRYDVKTLRELSEELSVSPNKIKNISSRRTRFSSLFKKKGQSRVFPKHSEKLAELIGVMLGDGNIFAFDRCQRLTVSCNSSYGKYTEHLKNLIRDIFKKEPIIFKRVNVNCHDLRLYMQDISAALALPVGDKIKNEVKIPVWIFSRKRYIRKCIKGLFETDGNYGINKKANVEYMEFCNKSGSLKLSVTKALTSLGYSPQLGNRYVRLAKKDQVGRFIAEMDFERPFPSLNVSIR